jgi:hypothetical protein
MAFQCPAATFVSNQSLVLRINIARTEMVKIATFDKPKNVMPQVIQNSGQTREPPKNKLIVLKISYISDK